MQSIDVKSDELISSKLIILTLVFLLSACAFNNSISFFPFDAIDYDMVDADNVNVYNNRLEIGNKFEEIGILKVKGYPGIESIKEQAASHGADGIVRDGKNYILVKIQFPVKKDEGGEHGFSI